MDTMIAIGAEAPNFKLSDLNGNTYSTQDFHDQIIVVNFWSAECHWCGQIDPELVTHTKAWEGRVQVLWIASNANEENELITRVADERNLGPVLRDADQHIADLYGAQTTPHFFIIDKDGKLAYMGAWNDITFRQRTASQVYVPRVVEALLNSQAPPFTQTQAYGCMLVRFAE